jgi:hypothetical protein
MSGILNLLLGSAAGVIKDAYFNLVTLLLNTTATNGAQNNTFLDSSTNNFSITRNGNTTQGTFTPFSQTGWSNYFPNSSGVRFPDNAVFSMSTNPFTCECWVYVTKAQSAAATFVSQWISGNDSNSSWMIGCNFGGGSGGSKFEGTISIGGSVTTVTDTSDFTLNTWHHLALSRSGSPGTLALFVDGVRVASSTPTGSIVDATNPVGIGVRGGNDGQYADGVYISNVRVVNGTDVYGATNTTYTVPTAPLTAITNTSLLTCQSNRYVDNSSNALTATVSGTPSVQAFSPFAPEDAYETAVVGGSGYFDGNLDSLEVAGTPNAAFQFGTGNFTMECWMYSPTGLGSVAGDNIFDTRDSNTFSSTSAGVNFFNTGYLNVYIGSANLGSSTPIPAGSWVHVALVRNGSTATLYQNGVSVVSSSASQVSNDLSNGYYRTGSWSGDGSFRGYLTNHRVVKGTAVYTANFTPPTAPLTAISGTTLLLNHTNAGIFDSAAKNDLETVSTAQVSTTQAKWGSTSMYFEGTSPYSYLKGNANLSQNVAFGTGDFTVECWVYLTTTASDSTIMDTRPGSNSANYFLFYLWTNGGAQLPTIAWYAPTSYVLSTGTVSSGVWTHIAISRQSGTIRSFKDGVLQQSATDTTAYANPGAPYPYIGASYNIGSDSFKGYIDDFRITRYARYTATFTPPAAAFPVQ